MAFFSVSAESPSAGDECTPPRAPLRRRSIHTPISEEQPTTGCPQARFDLPGLNLPLNWTPHEKFSKLRGHGKKLVWSPPPTADDILVYPPQGDGKDLFPTALDDGNMVDGKCSIPTTTLREFTMLHIMNSLTDKHGWEEKVFNDEIAANWKAEAVSNERIDVTEKMMDWIINELKWRSVHFKETGIIFVYNGDVVKSDSAIPTTLKTALRDAVKTLEDVLAIYKDYHPYSDGQVLNLVHPSLFPLIYGRSRVLEDRAIGLADCVDNIGKGKTVEVRPDDEMKLDRKVAEMTWGPGESPPYSKNFQWLPSDVDITNGDAKITSYINNLHPQHHQKLYLVINQIISKTIPLWNTTLSGLVNGFSLRRINYSLSFNPELDEKYITGEWGDEYYFGREDWENSTQVAPGDPEDFKVPEENRARIDLVKDFSDHGLQVIVKLATIELTPEKPEYSEGSWHVEGQLNEHICATALYYYDNTNISDSHLAFRQQTESEETRNMEYPNGIHKWLEKIYGGMNEGPTVQEVGSVLCKEDRLITFPNILQHRVQRFELADTTKPGHRKILALFLVDPHIRVISTANVPPQQREWWGDRLNTDFAGTEKALGKLSNELKNKVFEGVDDFPIGMEEAKEIRLRLMDERKIYGREAGQNFLKNFFNLREH